MFPGFSVLLQPTASALVVFRFDLASDYGDRGYLLNTRDCLDLEYQVLSSNVNKAQILIVSPLAILSFDEANLSLLHKRSKRNARTCGLIVCKRCARTLLLYYLLNPNRRRSRRSPFGGRNGKEIRSRPHELECISMRKKKAKGPELSRVFPRDKEVCRGALFQVKI